MSSYHIRIRQQLGRFTLDVDLQNEAGGVTAIFGPSGSGNQRHGARQFRQTP